MGRYRMIIDGKQMEVEVRDAGRDRYRVIVDGRHHEVAVESGRGGEAAQVRTVPAARPAPPQAQAAVSAAPVSAAPVTSSATAAGGRNLLSPMPGKVVALGAKVGDAVKRGAPIVTIEAMKMNVPVGAPIDGTVVRIAVAVGDSVQSGQFVAEIEPS